MSNDLRDFEQQVLQRSHTVPVVVDFWAPWCGPCKMLGPVLEKLAGEAEGRWDLVKVNTEEHQDLAARYEISSIPAVKCFRQGQVVDEFVGTKPEAQIRTWIEAHLGQPGNLGPADLEQAAELIDNGDLAQARTRLESILASTPNRHAARILLAEVLLSSEPARAAEVLLEIPADADESTHALALHLLAAAAQRPAEGFVEDPIKPRLLAGLAAIRQRDWDTALDAFIEVLERRRGYASGLAADAGKAIFRYLGIRHPIADKHYRRFSSALNS